MFINEECGNLTLLEKCMYSEMFRSAFSHIWTKHREILRISPYSVQMRENAYQNNSYYWHLLGNVKVANDGGKLTRKINQKEKSDVSEQSVDVHSVTNAGKSNSSILSISYVSMIFLVDCCEIT